MTTKAEVVLRASAELGEGPIWDVRRQALLWVDILGRKLHAFDPHTGRDREYAVGEMIGTVVPGRDGHAVVALTRRIAEIDLDQGTLTPMAELPASVGNVRFNDGKCDPRGRFWVGTLSLEGKREQGTLYQLDARRQFEPRVQPVSTSNGLAWSRDERTFYYIDTPTGRVDAFDFDADRGRIERRRPVVQFGPADGHPDGMTLDEEDMLWVAHWDGSCVTRHDPRTGRVLARIDLPAPRVTACWFGGPALDTLFITTARSGMKPDALALHPEAGHLFAVQPGVKGRPATAYAG